MRRHTCTRPDAVRLSPVKSGRKTLANDEKEKWVWTSLKYVLPVVALGGGLYIVWSYFDKQSRFANAKTQWESYFNAYMTKWEAFNADGTLTEEENAELERERVLLDSAQKDMSAAVNAPDPITYAIEALSIAGGAAILLKYGFPSVVRSLTEWQKQKQKSGEAKTQYTVYEMVHMADALYTAITDPILATQKMTAAQNAFQNFTVPSLQTEVNFLQAHMVQFTGIQLLYAQYMVANLMADVVFMTQVMYPFAFSLLPLV